MTNHFTTCPIKYPVSRVIPAFRKKLSIPIEAKSLSTLRALITCSRARAIIDPKTQPTTKKIIARTIFGVNWTKPHHKFWSEELNTSPHVSQILFIIIIPSRRSGSPPEADRLPRTEINNKSTKQDTLLSFDLIKVIPCIISISEEHRQKSYPLFA